MMQKTQQVVESSTAGKRIPLLGTLVDIHTGHTFRGGMDPVADSDIRALQIRDIRGREMIDPCAGIPVDWCADYSPARLQPGDVVLTARGSTSEAAVYGGGARMVAGSQLLVLRLRTNALTPEFLWWALHQPDAQGYLQRCRTGTSIQALSKKALSEMPFRVPSLHAQESILGMHDMARRERELLEELERNRACFLAGIYQLLLES